jgi:hypothetical protein
VPSDDLVLLHGGSASAHTRPASVRQAELPPFDADDPLGGNVHRVKPIELDIPAGFDNLFMRADFNGVTLNLARWGIPTPPAGQTLYGMSSANSTPAAMLMSTMMILYPRVAQDAHLTESAERGYSHYVICNWNDPDNGPTENEPDEMVQWAQYIQSWGFAVVYWAGAPQVNDPILHALVDAHALAWVIPGEEVDRRCTAEEYAAVLADTLSVTGGGIPIGAHTTANFPEGFPRDTFFDGRSMPSFADYNGKVHCCWQADQRESAGMQAARLYYARQRVSLGLVGGDGRAAPDSRVVAFETMASAQLMGECDERYGKLRTLQLLYATRLDPRIRAMDGGFGNGCGLPSGENL